MPSIKQSVGRKGKNAPADVRIVKELLNKNISTGVLTSVKVLPVNDVADDALYDAIEKFQGEVMKAATPDGKVDPQGRTWWWLAKVLNPNAKGGPFFPLAVLPASWTAAERYFGANRRDESGKPRAHGGCDLMCAQGTPVYAVQSGKVQLTPYGFKNGTYALEIDHGDFLIRYGEIKKECVLRQGDPVAPGEQIAEVGALGMLHFEMYDKSRFGGLTERNEKLSKKRKDGVSFQRRLDVIDPNPQLTIWKSRLPTAY
jgi:murein DD-endopeptidase MepM/ murein hydrolase activator NlpD